MRRLIFLTLIAASAVILAGCPGESGGTNNARTNGNSMTNLGTNSPNSNIVVTSNNTTTTTTANNTTGSTSNRWNANITEEEYNKDKANYSNGKRATETVGSGAKDGWIWFKTRSALATTADLRDSTIDVDVQNGVITLKGTVATAAQKEAAVKVANSIEGKTGAVKDQIKVSATDSVTKSVTDSDKPAANSNTKK